MPSESDNQVPVVVHPTSPEMTTPKRYFEPPDQPANDYSREASPRIKDALEAIKLEDFKKVHLQPCFREANLYGMGAGFAVSGLRFIFGGNIPKACNWAVGSFCLTSIACYEMCQYRRKKEKVGMMRAAEIIETKRMEREAQMAERRERAQKARETAAASQKSSWKFW